LSVDLVWALLFIAGVSGLLTLLAWLEPKHENPHRLQPLGRGRALKVTARAEVAATPAGPEEFEG
jgi:hypothetical protein